MESTMANEKLREVLIAASSGNMSDVSCLGDSLADINQADSDGVTALHVSSLGGHYGIATHLVENGADVNQVTEHGHSALMFACSKGSADVAEFLLLSGADPDSMNYNLEAPLHCVSRPRWNLEFTDEKVKITFNGSADVCSGGDDCQCLTLVKLLVHSGAALDHCDCDGKTALMHLIKNDHFESSRFLIKSGADVNLVSHQGNTALHVAAQAKHSTEFLNLLVSSGADVNQPNSLDGTTPLMLACYKNVKDVETLVKGGASINVANLSRETALGYAVYAENQAIVEFLLKGGAVIDKEFFSAVLIGHYETIQVFVTNGALPKRRGNIKCLKSDLDCISRIFKLHSLTPLASNLMEHLEKLDICWLTPFMVALMRKDDSVARYLASNLFFNPLDFALLQDFGKKLDSLENEGVSSSIVPLLSRPWSLSSLTCQAVSFALGFGSDREERIALSGLPIPLQRKLLFQDSTAFIPVSEWPKIDLSSIF